MVWMGTGPPPVKDPRERIRSHIIPSILIIILSKQIKISADYRSLTQVVTSRA
jgi:hypothetical protein